MEFERNNIIHTIYIYLQTRVLVNVVDLIYLVESLICHYMSKEFGYTLHRNFNY